MERTAAHRRVALPAALGALWVAFYAAWLAVDPGGARGRLVFSDTVYLVPVAAAAAFSVFAARRATSGLRGFWTIVAVSNALWLAGEALWAVRELGIGPVPFPWWTDVGYLGSTALLPVAIAIAFRPTARLVSASVLLDAALVVATVGLAWWWIVLRPLTLAPTLGSVVGLAYPSLDLIVLGLLLCTRLLPSRQGTLALSLYAGGVAVGMIADGLYNQAQVTNSYFSGNWMDLGWQAEAVLFALAAYVSGRGLDRRSDWLRARRPARLGTTVVTTTSLALVIVLLARSGGESVGLVVWVAAIGLLLCARVWVALAPAAAPLRDPETGAYAPEYLREQLHCLAARARRFADPFAVALVDIDGAGPLESAVDVEVTRRLLAGGREVDAVARLAAGRLAVLLPQVEDVDAVGVVERLRREIAAAPIRARGRDRVVTVSVGVAHWSSAATAEGVLEAAERALASAHSLGGNQVRAAGAGGTFGRLVELGREVDEREAAGSDHSRVIAELARNLALAVGLDPEQADRAYVAGLLHDVGKVTLPDWLLRKPGPLTPAEWATMWRHPERGAELLTGAPDLREAAPIVLAHHERWDGSGYPYGVKGDFIPVEARIVAVVDSLVSMTSERAYRPPLTLTYALTDIWRQSGKTYDSAVVGALFALVREGRVRSSQDQVGTLQLA